MKYLITESKLEQAIINYLDEIFPIDEINWTHPYDEFDDGSEGEDPTRIEFYKGDYEDEEVVFRWYACEYFTPYSNAQTICPEVSIEHPYVNYLNGYFDNMWEKPFIKWLQMNFDIKVKTVS